MDLIYLTKYPLTKGDTLESVAEKLNIETEYLKEIHNGKARFWDKIRSSFPKHLTEIYVYSDVLEAQSLEKEVKREIGRNLFPVKFYASKTYGYTFENFEGDLLKNKIHYEIEAVYKKNDFDLKIIEINRKQVYINHKMPDVAVEQLLDKIAQNLFPIALKIGDTGEIKAIANHNVIKERWLANKEELTDYYKKEQSDTIIQKADLYFNDEKELMKMLSKNWFFNLFFKPVYGYYPEKKEIQYVAKVPFLSKGLLEYEIAQTLQNFYTKSGKLIVTLIGKTKDHRTIDEVLQNKTVLEKDRPNIQTIQSQGSVQYKLNSSDNSIFSVIGTFETKMSNEKINKIQIEIYQQ
ncbi:hypothetical protein [Flavobacterium tructae]|uniref:hypothetical protein n=1 Tax=Flavobacterium tructae TaxID=1114873 RepID=UPI0035A92A3F